MSAIWKWSIAVPSSEGSTTSSPSVGVSRTAAERSSPAAFAVRGVSTIRRCLMIEVCTTARYSYRHSLLHI